MILLATAETAYAKLNLALHVRAREANGYHRIETLFAFCEQGDTVAVVEGGPPLAVEGPFAAGLDPGPANLVRRAAEGLAQLVGIPVPPLRLTKRLPVAAGIGGGSADAAAAMRLLCRLNDLSPATAGINALAVGLGADVPACLASRAVRGDGRGDILTPIPSDDLAGLPVLLVNPRLPLATGAVFAAWDGIDRGSLADGAPLAAALAGRNDLQPAAVTLMPTVGALVATLARQPGCRFARMSGSGATCFGLFVDEPARDAAASSLAEAFPDAWQLATRLRHA